MWNLARIGFIASEKMLFENIDDDGRTDGRPDGRRLPAYTYKLTYEA